MMMLGTAGCGCAETAGTAGLAGNAPVVGKMSSDPEFKALKAKADAQPTLPGKLGVVNVEAGFWAPGFKGDKDWQRKTVLTRLILEDALPDNPDAVCVLHASLLGAIDESEGYGYTVPNGAMIQETCDTDLSLDEAVEALKAVDPVAARMVAMGAVRAGASQKKDYGDRLYKLFKSRFVEWANPFTNPLWGGAVQTAAVVGVAYLAWRWWERRHPAVERPAPARMAG